MIERAESSAIIKVAFDGDDLEVVRDGDRVLVVVRRVCDVLGVDTDSQAAKLRASPWATTAIIAAVGADRKRREQFCLDVKCLGMWLATINPRKVGNAALRPKLVRYQIDAARVLDDLFFGRQQQPQQGLIHIAKGIEDIQRCLAMHPIHAGCIGQSDYLRRQLNSSISVVAKAMGVHPNKARGHLRREFKVTDPFYIPICEEHKAREFLHSLTINTPIGKLAKQLTLWPIGGALDVYR